MSHRRIPILSPDALSQACTSLKTRPSRAHTPHISRREFIELAAALTAFLAACGPRASSPSTTVGPELPSLGGAPDTDAGRNIAAFVDAVIPGKHRDPSGRPGALDVDAAGVFFDPALPAAALVPLLVLVLDWISDDQYKRAFIRLTPEQREEVVQQATEKVPQMRFAVQLAKLAYFSSRTGGAALGFPGANFGYAHDANMSFNSAVAQPHPNVISSGDGAGHYK